MKFLSLLLLVACVSTADAGWLVRKEIKGQTAKILSVRKDGRELSSGESSRVLRSIPKWMGEEIGASKEIYEETLYANEALPQELHAYAQKALHFAIAPEMREMLAGSEVRTLVDQGPPENRINLTIVGDGYTAAQKLQFFVDAQRITDDLFGVTTFASYLPLFNVYAVFVPSRESGLTDGKHKVNTALGLFRSPPGSKRAVMPGNFDAIDQAISLAPATDYPILLANDDFYGGLGGQYAITTRSAESGSMVLRHELGHNFGQVGEEYDGGQVYQGANFSSSSNVTWKHWVTGRLEVYESKFLSGEYLWENLSKGSIQVPFDFPSPLPQGEYIFGIIISTVGWKTSDDVFVYIDGQKVELDGIYTEDRSFFTFHLNSSLKPGRHVLEFKENVKSGDHVLAFAEAYAHAPGFDFTPGKIAAFANYDESNTHVGYRPTFYDCLMRNMRSRDFCPVDKENMWLRFLSKVNLLDQGLVSHNSDGSARVELKTPKLTGLNTHWFLLDANGAETELMDLQGQSVWDAPVSASGKKYRVRLKFETAEIRKSNTRTEAKYDFSL